MNKYMIVQETIGGGLEIIVVGDTRESAYAALKDKAVARAIYHEIKLLGDPIVVKTRETTVLSRVSTAKEILVMKNNTGPVKAEDVPQGDKKDDSTLTTTTEEK